MTELKRGRGRPRKLALPVDTDLLSDEKKHELRQKAKAGIREEQEDDAAAAYLAKVEEEERRKLIPSETMVEITLDLAEHSDRLVIDGAHYFHGRSYTVPMSVALTMREMASRGWDHQAEIDGKKKDTYRKAKNLTLHPVHGIINTSNLARG